MSTSSDYDYSDGEFAADLSSGSEREAPKVAQPCVPARSSTERKEGWRSSSSGSMSATQSAAASARSPALAHTPSMKIIDSKLSTNGSEPMSKGEFARKLEQQTKYAWAHKSPKTPVEHGAFNASSSTMGTTRTATAHKHSKLRSRFYQPSFSQQSAPELQLVTGFEAKVYAELLQVKKDIQRLRYEKDKLTTAHRRVTQDVLHEERKYRALLEAEGNVESVKSHKARGKSHAKNIRSACGTLVLSEAARTLARKERMSMMMVDLKGTIDEIKELRGKRAYKHFERLTEAEETLHMEMEKLRLKLEKRRTTETIERTSCELHEVREAISTADITIEHLKKEARRHEANTSSLGHDVKAMTEKVDAQHEVKDRLLLKVGETQQASQMKRDTVPVESEKLQDRLRELEGVTMQKCNELELLKANMGKQIEAQRGALMNSSETVELLRVECRDLESAVRDREKEYASLQQQVEGSDAWEDVQKAHEEQAETAWCKRKTELGELKMKEEEAAEEVKILQGKLRNVREERRVVSEQHADKVSALREGAEKRQEALLGQLSDTLEGNGRYCENTSVSRSPPPDDTFTQTTEEDTYQSPHPEEEVQTAIMRRMSPPSNILSPSEDPFDEATGTLGSDELDMT